MIDVDIGNLELSRVPPLLEWIVENYGTTDQGRWDLIDLRYLRFSKDSDATWFILKWT
jgi:hypothetical protein